MKLSKYSFLSGFHQILYAKKYLHHDTLQYYLALVINQQLKGIN